MTAGVYVSGTYAPAIDGSPVSAGVYVAYDSAGNIYVGPYAGTSGGSVTSGISPNLEGLLSGSSFAYTEAGFGPRPHYTFTSSGAYGVGVGSPGPGGLPQGGLSYGFGPFSPTSWIGRLFGFSFDKHDPLILDLNLDGISLTSLDGSNAHFDLDVDGFAERTGWVSATDGLLALDKNGNGLIDNADELFGNATTDGFSVLADYDSNHDGVINASDVQFLNLRVWQDSNQDGISQASELRSLTDVGVVSISVAATVSQDDIAGNSVLYRGGFAYADGSQGEVAAIGFATDQINTQYIAPQGFTLDPEVFALPNLRGYGEVPDLWVAMSIDPTLKQMVKDLITNFDGLPGVLGHPAPGISDVLYASDDFENMLARWAGIDTISMYTRTVETAEAFMNRQADHAAGNPYFYEAFAEFAAQEAIRFYTQAPTAAMVGKLLPFVDIIKNNPPANGSTYTQAELDNLVQPIATEIQNISIDPDLIPFLSVGYDFFNDTIIGDTTALFNHLFADFDFTPADPWSGWELWRDERQYILKVLDPDGMHTRAKLREISGNTALDQYAGQVEVDGTGGSDTLIGGQGADASRPDILKGLAGNDLLQGDGGNDIYVFADGFGSDVVDDSDGTRDEIAFQGSLVSTLADYSFGPGGRTDLLITFQGRSDTLLVKNYFASNGAAMVEAITFPDGPEISQQAIRDAVFAKLATSGADLIEASGQANTLNALAGNDTLQGQAGNDTLTGGAGNDLLMGGYDNDTYCSTLVTARM